MKKRMALLLFGFFLPVALLTQGCLFEVGPPDPGIPVSGNGSIRVDWLFSGIAGCPDDVDEVEVQVDNSFTKRVVCDNGRAFVGALPEGTYDVRLLGFEIGDPDPTWESGWASIDVIADTEANIRIDLDPL